MAPFRAPSGTIGPRRPARMYDFRRQILDRDPRTVSRVRNHPLNLVSELPNIPRPIVLGQGIDRILGHRQRLLARSRRKMLKEVGRQNRYLFATLAKRRNVDPNDVEPMK